MNSAPASSVSYNPANNLPGCTELEGLRLLVGVQVHCRHLRGIFKYKYDTMTVRTVAQ